MAKKTVFSDEDNNDLECFINHEGKVFIGVGRADESALNSSFITLDKVDVGHLIKILSELESEMED